MNSDMLLNRIRMAQQGLIGVHKKLYTLEHLLPSPDEEYRRQHALPHFSDCVICIEHIYDRCLPITAVRDYDNLEFKSILDVIALYCMKDDTGALCDLYHTTRFSYASCTMISVMPKKSFPAWLSTQMRFTDDPPQFAEKS